MYVFQRKIIYMGYIPPGTRQERLADVRKVSPTKFLYEETMIPSSDGVKLNALLMKARKTDPADPSCIVLYLQGNAGNPLHRIPVFEKILTACTNSTPVIVAAAPRSYWRSTNKTPTQRGILADYRSALLFAARRWPNVPIVLYGHSLGGSVAVSLLRSLSDEPRSPRGLSIVNSESESDPEYEPIQDLEVEAARRIQGLILENPFSSIPDMVRALYPQRWLPYRFLAPFAWDKWDALAAMNLVSDSSFSPTSDTSLSPHKDANVTAISSSAPDTDTINTNNSTNGNFPEHGRPDRLRDIGSAQEYSTLRRVAKDMLVLVSARDEVVPREMGEAIYAARPLGGNARLVVIDRALHEDAWRQNQWAREVSSYLDKKGGEGRKKERKENLGSCLVSWSNESRT